MTRNGFLRALVLVCILMASSSAHGSYIFESESNDTLTTAQDISSAWTKRDTPGHVANGYSHFWYWAAVRATGDETPDYFSFKLLETTAIQFDVDYADTDLGLVIWQSTGNNSFTGKSSIGGHNGLDPGSNSTDDPYWYYRPLAAGTYVVGIDHDPEFGKYNNTGFTHSNSGIPVGSNYCLSFATFQEPFIAPNVVPEPMSMVLFGLGGGLLVLRKKIARRCC